MDANNMKRKIIPVLIGCTLSFSALAAQPTAERYVVSFPEGTHVNYAGAFASAFPNGLPVGIGSGLLFTGKQGDALTFATITDRGPNADSPKEGKNETKIFVTPDFAPLLMTIRVQNGKAEAIDPRPLHDDKGAINGLPLASDVIGSTNEVAFSDTLHRLKGDNRGLDTEGITPDGKGGYWLCDEYGPFLINIDSKGKILAIHGPQAAANDNDFGVKVAMQHPVEGKTFKDYRVNAEGKLTLDDKQVETTLRVKPLEKPESDSELWIVTLPEALK
ncbi:hypothetical protein D4L72_22130 [Shigella flexneri]|nr:hypothetical protein [Shigella flexneri]